MTLSRWPTYGPTIITIVAVGANDDWSMDPPYTAVTWWLLICWALCVPTCAALAYHQFGWQPRQPYLAAGMWALLVVVRMVDYFAFSNTVYDAFGFNVQVLCGVLEMPIRYYIMLLDSRSVLGLMHTRMLLPHCQCLLTHWRCLCVISHGLHQNCQAQQYPHRCPPIVKY